MHFLGEIFLNSSYLFEGQSVTMLFNCCHANRFVQLMQKAKKSAISGDSTNHFFLQTKLKMPMRNFDTSPNITVDKAALRERLTPVEYQVTQEKMTER